MPENTPRYRLVLAKYPRDADSMGNWCWAILDSRTGRVHRTYFRSRVAYRDASNRHYTEARVARLNEGRIQWHDHYWDRDFDLREVEDA